MATLTRIHPETGVLRGCSNLTTSCNNRISGGTGKWMLCSACRGAEYCFKECQVAHWKTHKPDCKATVAANAAPGGHKEEYIQLQRAHLEVFQHSIAVECGVAARSALRILTPDSLVTEWCLFLNIQWQGPHKTVDYKDVKAIRKTFKWVEARVLRVATNPIVKDAIRAMPTSKKCASYVMVTMVTSPDRVVETMISNMLNTHEGLVSSLNAFKPFSKLHLDPQWADNLRIRIERVCDWKIDVDMRDQDMFFEDIRHTEGELFLKTWLKELENTPPEVMSQRVDELLKEQKFVQISFQ